MSWFDAGALANIAKSALKGAQKTIDKALDIKEEVETVVPNTPIESSDFFGTWGVSQSDHVTPTEVSSKPQSIWGSFTGSFFVDNASTQPEDHLDDSSEVNEQHFSKSKLVVQQEDEEPPSGKNEQQEIAPENSKNNSESVDVLSGTLSPDSELYSFGLSSSSSGMKLHTSESVDVLGDSLTSPSSVEVIGTDSIQDESSSIEEKFNSPSESVEVIPEDRDENSAADDTMSYTSMSESTATTVLDTVCGAPVKPQKMLKDTYMRTDFGENDSTQPAVEAITKAPSRCSHLPLQQVNQNQMMIDTQPQSANKPQDLPNILENTNIIDIPQDDDVFRSSGSDTQLDTSTEDGSISDKTLVETLENTAESGSDSTSTTTTTETSSNSTYLKKMLADAMVERCADDTNPTAVNRETSPFSSERSDLVKIGSDRTSCHTSGDELETTTSSDIEIISSPNGDSSSTQSRQSPSKLARGKVKVDVTSHKMTATKIKGHAREPSEASSISDDSNANSDADRLLKRICELTEILEARERKLIELNRRDSELLEQNVELKRQLESALAQQSDGADLTQVTEEYTQRLSALEKKFQQAIREKDSLRKQLEQSKLEAATRPSRHELESTVAEKDETIKELREEGEKLSKQQLQHSNIIKKLRAKEKEREATVAHLKATNEALSAETERLNKSLQAKQTMERNQIEAVHTLTVRNRQLETELAAVKGQLEDATQQCQTVKISLDAVKSQLADANKTIVAYETRQLSLEQAEQERKVTESQKEEVINRMDSLRDQLRKTEEDYVKMERKLKRDNGDLLRRLEEAEARNEELSQTVLEVSKPLMRQLDSLQAAHAAKTANFEKIETELTLKIGDLTNRLHAAVSSERAAKEECHQVKAKLVDLETYSRKVEHELEVVKIQLNQVKTEKELVESEFKGEIDKLNDLLKKRDAMIEEKNEELSNLRQQLTVYDNQLRQTVQETSKRAAEERHSPTRSNSPALSLGKASDSFSWSQDDAYEHTPRYANLFEVQTLQTSLQQRDGAVQQLRWELERREHERALLNTEIATLQSRVEALEQVRAEHERVTAEFDALRHQYDALCQLYGEKVEENEELKLDLADVKEMYKCQIDDLLRQQTSLA